MHQIRFRLGLRSRPNWATGGAYSAPQTPYLDFRGPTSKGSEGRGRGEKGKWRGGNERGKGRKGRQAPPSPPPSQFATPLGRRSGEAFAASGTLGDLTWLEDFLTSKWPCSFTALAPPLLIGHHCPFTGTKLYCWWVVAEAHMWAQFAQGFWVTESNSESEWHKRRYCLRPWRRYEAIQLLTYLLFLRPAVSLFTLESSCWNRLLLCVYGA